MANAVLIPREQVVFMVAESTPGTLEQPSAGDALAVVGLPGVPQQTPSYTPSEEVANSRSVLAHARDSYGPGNWSLDTYLRPSGAAGTPPPEAALWEGLLGSESIVASTAVTYDPALTLKRYSLWWRGNDNVVLFARGATVNELTLSASDRGFLSAGWSGECQEVGRCGETTLNGALTGGETDVPVAHAERYTTGAPVTIGTSTGHVVTAVDYSAGNLTVTPAVSGAQSDAAAVVPELPTPTYSGTPAECRNGGLTIDAVAVKFRSLEIRVSNQVAYIDDEVDSSSEFPADFVAGARSVEGSAQIVLRSDDLSHWRRGESGDPVAVEFTVLPSRTGGTDAGYSFGLELAQAVVNVSEIGDAGPAVGATLAITGRASSAGEDEMAAEYT